MMRNIHAVIAVLIILGLPGSVALEEAEPQERIVFRPLDIWLDSGNEKLAAYQVELRYSPATVKIVGIEGGTGAFNPAPYYDRAGMSGGKIIIAAFTTDEKRAPEGRTRVARVHLQVQGEGAPDVSIRLAAAVQPAGERISPRVELTAPQGRE